MNFRGCPDCGSRVYSLGCTWCDEERYMEEQEAGEAAFHAADAAGRICSRCDCEKKPEQAYCGGAKCKTDDLK